MRVKSKIKEDSHPHILLFFRMKYTLYYEEEERKGDYTNDYSYNNIFYYS